MTALRIGPGLELPPDVITRRLAILAMSGAGKSNAAVVLAEEMHRAGLPWVAIDPKGDWWGVRSSRDGKGAGLAVPVLGGLRGDMPLNPADGRIVAEFVAEKRPTCVLDVSEFDSNEARYRFLYEFAETLLRKNRDPLHLFLEEADEYLPQSPKEKGYLPRCLGAWQRVVKRGRFRGLGCSLISQRSAALHKDVLNMAEALIVLRTTAPRDKNAIKEWVSGHDVDGRLIETLPMLEDGQAWVWSPQWLKLTKKVQIRRRETYDSGATPHELRGRRAPATMADVDLGALEKRLAETREQAKANDPAELRRQVAELKKELAAARAARPAPERVEVPAIDEDDARRFEVIASQILSSSTNMQPLLESMLAALQSVRKAFPEPRVRSNERMLSGYRESERVAARVRRLMTRAEREAVDSSMVIWEPEDTPRISGGAGNEQPTAGRVATVPVRTATGATLNPAASRAGASVALGRAERALLTVLAQRQPRKTSRAQLAVLSGYSNTSSSFSNALGSLRSRGLSLGMGDDNRITPAGVAALGPYDAPPDRGELVAWWAHKLGRAERAMLEHLVAVYPEELSKEGLSAATGYSVTSSSFSNALGKLRTLELVTPAPRIQAAEELCE